MKFCSKIAALLIAAYLFVPSSAVQPKPGMCPKAFNTLLPVPSCGNDTDCFGADKCCKYGNESVCAPPITRSRRALTKPGRCPMYFISFAPFKPCRRDRDCSGIEKCCAFDSGPICVPPESPALQCPPPSRFGPCIEACFDGCKNGQICCFNGCGHECMTPVPV